MQLRVRLTQCLSIVRDFVAPSYRPELHYMRGPGPEYTRRAVHLHESRRSCAIRFGSTSRRDDNSQFPDIANDH